MMNIKLESLKSDKKDLCKYIKSDNQLLIFKITLDYLQEAAEFCCECDCYRNLKNTGNNISVFEAF